MSDDERERWDQRYATDDYLPRPWPTPFLEQWVTAFGSGRALDIACGTGRNALYLAEHGFEVTGIDVSEVAIERASHEARSRGLEVRFVVADLDDLVFEGSFDLITVIRYRNPDLWRRLVAALEPNGWILVEHHFKTSVDVAGPTDSDFQLDPGELLDAFARLRIVHYSESIEPADDAASTYAIARAVACNGDPGW